MTLSLQIFQFILSGLTTGSTYALIAIGFSLIHNATGIVNFAQGEFVMLGGMFMITFYTFLKLPCSWASSSLFSPWQRSVCFWKGAPSGTPGPKRSSSWL